MPTPSAIDYTSRDYAGLRESMLAYAQQILPDWRGAAISDPNDFGVALIEVFAYEGDVLSYYGDRIANEAFLTTATQRGSVLAHAALLDYTPRSATSATTQLTFTVTSPVDVIIPAGFEVQTAPDGINEPVTFETDTDLEFPASDEPVTLTVSATEGYVVEDEVLATSCGDLDAEYTLQQVPAVADSLVVRVVETPLDSGQVWIAVNSLLNVGPTENAYSIRIDENDALTVVFGDGTNGRVPPRGAVIHAAYRVGGGEDGNVAVGTVTEIVDPTDLVYPPVVELDENGDVVATTPVEEPDNPPFITVINSTEGTGGTEAESLESIRVNAPRALRARDRAITLEDYEALALTVPQVQIAKAKAVAQVYTNVTVYVAPPGGTLPDAAALLAVVRHLETRKLANVTVVAAQPRYVSIDVAVDVQVNSRFNQQSVKQAVQNALQGFLAFDNVNFGGRVALSDIYTTVAAVPGVDNAVVGTLARNRGTGAQDVVLRDNELPISGTFTLQATGGITASPGSPGDFIGGEQQTQPTASSAPNVTLLRSDPNSTHVELLWTAGDDTSSWDILVSYIDSTGAVVYETTVGPFTRTQGTLDLPLIGDDRATQIRFRTLAYNGAVGPVPSAGTTVPYDEA